jgi:hypothetical protein
MANCVVMRTSSNRRLAIPRILAATVLGMVAACPDDAPPEEPEDCPALQDMAACEAGTGCAWDPQDGECVVDCAAIEERATCNTQDQCFWLDDVCHFGVL